MEQIKRLLPRQKQQQGGSQNATSEFIYRDYGNDEIQGSSRSDHLSGGPGSDVIYGNDGGDYIQGGPGIDSLYGEEGNDVLSGGEGADYFDCGPGRDSIDDFDSTEGDYASSNCEVIENEERPSQQHFSKIMVYEVAITFALELPL